METYKIKYPGFIDGLKASNINLNKTSLDEYSEQILFRISFLYTNKELPTILTEQLKRSEETIKSSLKKDSADDVIHYYIKFGDIFKSITLELKKHYKSTDFKDIAINYLKIAKYSKDSRVKDLAIAIAQDIE